MGVTRRIAGIVASRFANRRVVFAIAAVSILGAKVTHIYAHLAALSPPDLLRWGPSFFTQDVALLLVVRILLDGHIFTKLRWRWLQITAPTLAAFVVLFVLVLAAIDISFFTVVGSELHWRNITLAGDSSSWSTLLTGLVSCAVVFAAVLVASWITQDLCYAVAGLALEVIRWPFAFTISRLPSSLRRRIRPTTNYDLIRQQDDYDALERSYKEEVESSSDGIPEEPQYTSNWIILMYMLIAIFLLGLLVSSICRPWETSFIFMSWTLPLLPFLEFAHSSPLLAGLLPFRGNGINWSWDNQTALAQPPSFPWLPDTALPGFEDWYQGDEHYTASEDPLKISNLDEDVLPSLRSAFKDIDIRHVVLIKLESTRKDLFPFKKDGLIWDKLVDTFENKTMTEEATQRLASLTSTANFLTGDYDDGFEHDQQKRRGGLNFNNAFPTGTYTLKTLAGTLCGISGLVADFNAEATHHVYQPCLAHIFNALNKLDHTNDTADEGFRSYKWRNWFMQSVTMGYDSQDDLMLPLGYPDEDIISKEYLKSDGAKFGDLGIPDINYFGMPETALTDYIRDAFVMAEKNNERVFLTHLTSTSHHPFAMPEEEEYVPLSEHDKLDELSHYLNAMGYVDRWLQKVLDILDQQGVADETLVVLVGDHGLSLPENGAITPYENPCIGNFHIPLVLSHPKLPAIDINDRVIASSILPTILDMLLETDSLSPTDRRAASDLVQNYEGQSLVRPQRRVSQETGQPEWQFSVSNPGRSTVSVRDTGKPARRLAVPVIDNMEWRYTDLDADPHEEHPVLSFGFAYFLRKVEFQYGIEAALWAEEAAFITRWWVDENSRRWRFDPSA